MIRRIVFFFVFLLFLFVVTYGLSILLFPMWLQQSSELSTLSLVIVGGGFVVIGEAILSWALSFLFADKEFRFSDELWGAV